jgi:hypothetical protein
VVQIRIQQVISRGSIPIASAAAVAAPAASTEAASTTAAASTVAASTTAAASTETTAATATTAASFFARPGFVDGQCASAVLLTIKRGDRRLGFVVVAHLDESEAF